MQGERFQEVKYLISIQSPALKKCRRLYTFDNKRDGKHYLYLTLVEWADGEASIPYKYVYGGFRPKDEEIVTASKAMDAYDSKRGGEQQILLYGEFLDDRAGSVLFVGENGEKEELFGEHGGYIFQNLPIYDFRLEALDTSRTVLKSFDGRDVESEQ